MEFNETFRAKSQAAVGRPCASLNVARGAVESEAPRLSIPSGREHLDTLHHWEGVGSVFTGVLQEGTHTPGR
ncbi:hypothetical protein E2C01_068877 [Portunus trituberculatus]|uniref:Uncharacterized protein n=1 Tax=Portunus trituberculatus TaxID=210409 RepID=A0A5B7HZ36_PORTR|nr:hypothetical protein [Portunus trituberculatus]